MKDLICILVLLVVVAAATLTVLANYHPSPIMDVINSCTDTAQIVGNCSVR